MRKIRQSATVIIKNYGSRSRSPHRRITKILCGILGVGIFIACGKDSSGTAPTSLSRAIWALQLDQHAIVLSVAPPSNSIQLHATLIMASGAPPANVSGTTYQVLGNDTSVVVTPSGLVTAKVPSYYIAFSSFHYPISMVIASLTIEGVTFADTAFVLVTATAPATPLDSFSIHPPVDSLASYQHGTWLTEGNGKFLDVTALDINHHAIPDSLIYVTTSDPAVALGHAGSLCLNADHPITGFWCVLGVKGNAPVTLYAQTWYYGVARADTLPITVGYTNIAYLNTFQRTPWDSLTSQLYWWPNDVDLTAPARVWFFNYFNTTAIDVVFDDSLDVEADTADANIFTRAYGYTFPLTSPGNIAPFYADTVGGDAACASDATRAEDSTCVWKGYGIDSHRMRLFTKPGTYTYHTLFGNGGRIIVH